jgi:uncharacterized membrane protein
MKQLMESVSVVAILGIAVAVALNGPVNGVGLGERD